MSARFSLALCPILMIVLTLSNPANASERLVRAWPQSVGLPATMTEELDAGLEKAVESGATAIVASHEPDRIAALATRSVVVAGGRVTEGATA